MSSGREDDWFQHHNSVKMPVSEFVQPLSNNIQFDRTPFTYGGYPKVCASSLIGPCSLCGRDGRVRCSRCKDWYCSQSCQIDDWLKHKRICLPVPPLEFVDG